ncbi:MAG: methylenetetrahydrofolate reductase C-terminal domain-containing protein [Anaerolineaceae bacterium]|nr:methylenetetrahydrofolate reductase C-terminal domain-containing protein [Anaerolineaceae bacterium]
MPIFSPKPFQKPYLPVEQDRAWSVRTFTALERSSKEVLFGCRMCGNCILQETAFICPMTCAKGLRNGFCGEAAEGRCVVDSSRTCTWLEIYHRAESMGRMDKLMEINAPVDGGQAGHSAWLPLMKLWSERGKPNLLDLVRSPRKFKKELDELFFDFRQPAWWNGDSVFHPPAYQEPVSRLEAALRSQPFVLTTDITQPSGCTPEEIVEKCRLLEPYVVSFNIDDNPYAVSRASSVASCKVCIDHGYEPVLQMTVRDRSRNAILSDVLGASMLGIRNVLCLGGDYHNKELKTYPVQPIQYDVDPAQMLWMLRRMRDEGKLPNGREIEDRPQYFLGAAGSNLTLPPHYSAMKLEKKINAGAQFIQTQLIFDVKIFEGWLGAAEKRSLLDKAAILAGIYPLRTAEEAHLLAVEPGISIPKEIIKRMDAAAEKDRLQGTDSTSQEFQEAESREITRELMQQIRQLPGIRGIHLMTGGRGEIIPGLLENMEWPAS